MQYFTSVFRQIFKVARFESNFEFCIILLQFNQKGLLYECFVFSELSYSRARCLNCSCFRENSDRRDKPISWDSFSDGVGPGCPAWRPGAPLPTWVPRPAIIQEEAPVLARKYREFQTSPYL